MFEDMFEKSYKIRKMVKNYIFPINVLFVTLCHCADNKLTTCKLFFFNSLPIEYFDSIRGRLYDSYSVIG